MQRLSVRGSADTYIRFAIALGRITTAQHLLNHTADPLILWVLAQETLQVIPKDLPEMVQREPWSDRHYGDFSTL